MGVSNYLCGIFSISLVYALLASVNAFRYPSCDHSVEYWSNSCGAIASTTSKICSLGGTLVYRKSCNTHFAPYSRGCSFLYMGCRSKCRISAPSCDPGKVGFAPKKNYVYSPGAAEGVDQFKLTLARYRDWDNDIGCKVRILDADGNVVFTSGLVSWKNEERHLKEVEVGERNLRFVRFPAVAVIVDIDSDLIENERSKVKIVKEELKIGGFVSFDRKVYSAFEGHEILEVGLSREVPEGFKDSKMIVKIGVYSGTAVDVLDFQLLDKTVVFEVGEREKTVSVEIFLDAEKESKETFSLFIKEVNGGLLKQGSSNSVVTIVNDKSTYYDTLDSKLNRLLKLKWFQEFPYDPNTKFRLLESFVHRKVRKGTVLFDLNDYSNALYVIESGVCDVIKSVDDPVRLATVTDGESFGDLVFCTRMCAERQ